MKIYLEDEVPQGTPAWHQLRLGRPTASQAHRIITAVKGDLSKQRVAYGYQLVAERILQEPFATRVSNLPWVIEGKEREATARDAYAEIMGVELQRVGFIATDDGRWGCSPDSLIVADGRRGGLEIKAPTEVVQVGYLIEGGPGESYRQQTQMQCQVAQLEYNDFFSFHPRMPPVRVRLTADEEYIKKLEAALREFADELDDWEKRVRAMGYFSPAAAVKTEAARTANAIMADPASLEALGTILIRDGEEGLEAALEGLPLEERQRVREAIEGEQMVARMGAG